MEFVHVPLTIICQRLMVCVLTATIPVDSVLRINLWIAHYVLLISKDNCPSLVRLQKANAIASHPTLMMELISNVLIAITHVQVAPQSSALHVCHVDLYYSFKDFLWEQVLILVCVILVSTIMEVVLPVRVVIHNV
jgi:hypothetical protein